MSLGFNTLGSFLGRWKGLGRSAATVGVGLVAACTVWQLACRPAAAAELQSLISSSLTSGLVDVSALDIDAADRALAVSRASLETHVANSRTFVRPAAGSLMSDASPLSGSISPIAIRPAQHRIAAGDQAGRADRSGQATAGDVADMLPLSRAAFPLLVGGLAVETPSIKTSSASLRPLAGPVVGVRPSFLRPGMVAGR